jgi:hypothetical protein
MVYSAERDGSMETDDRLAELVGTQLLARGDVALASVVIESDEDTLDYTWMCWNINNEPCNTMKERNWWSRFSSYSSVHARMTYKYHIFSYVNSGERLE